MADYQMRLSREAKVVHSLLEEAQEQEKRFSGSDNLVALGKAKQLIEGNVAAARRAAEQLSGDERALMLAKCYHFQAHLAFCYMRDDRDAEELAQRALGFVKVPEIYILLGKIRKTRKDVEGARAAFNDAESSAPYGSEVCGVAQKELRKLDAEGAHQSATITEIKQGRAKERSFHLGCMAVVAIIGFISLNLMPIVFFLIIPIFIWLLIQYIKNCF